MKSHRRLSSPKNPVSFLKIILSDDTSSTGIRLPQKFTEEYGKYLSNRVTLKVPNGDVWHVDLQKSNDEFWLKNGWEKLAECYNIRFAYLLMFKYEGSSTFGVVIFNPGASEIEYPKNTDRVRSSVKLGARKCPDSCSKSKIVIMDDDDDDCDTSSSRSEDQEQGIKIKDEASKIMKRKEEAKANFKEPFFMVHMNTSYLSNRGVFLPEEFRRKLLRGHKNHRQCLLLLEDEENMKTYMVVAQDKYMGNADWLMFVEDNGIKVGDICVFELFHEDKSVLGVTIIRSGS